MSTPPLGPKNFTLACARMLPGGDCSAPAIWHVFWYDKALRPVEWENSLTCQEHMDDAAQRWTVGFRHPVSPACGMPGAVLHVSAEDDDEDGNPVTSCVHPFDQEQIAVEATAVLQGGVSNDA